MTEDERPQPDAPLLAAQDRVPQRVRVPVAAQLEPRAGRIVDLGRDACLDQLGLGSDGP